MQTLRSKKVWQRFVCAAILLVGVLGMAATAQQAQNSRLVQTAQIPDGGQIPDTAVDKNGVVHLVYGKETDAFYAQSRDGGKTFAAPVRLNARNKPVTVGGERGPKIALGKNGMICVLWQGDYRSGGGVWFTRSLDNGKTFAPPRNLLDAQTGIDEPTLTADAQGNIVALWLDGREKETADNAVTSPLFMARSMDNGATWSKNEALKYDFPGRACSCCTLWARIDGPDLLVAFRTGYKNIRDMYLLRGLKLGNDFHATQVSADNWQLLACPMSGPRFALEPEEKGSAHAGKANPLLLAWMSAGKVYMARQQGEKPFATRIAAPQAGQDNYPFIACNSNQRFLLIWIRSGKIQWACYRSASAEKWATLEAEGEAGEAVGRPCVFVRSDGTFVIVK